MPRVPCQYHYAQVFTGELNCYYCHHHCFWTRNVALSAAARTKMDSKMFLCS